MKILRVLAYAIVALLLLAGAAFAYLSVRRPEIAPPSSIRIEGTPEKIARGQYLVLASGCEECHSQADYTRFGLPKLPDIHFAGQELPKEMGLPGRVVAPNLTPDRETGLGGWTDGEKIRAIREGIDKDGNALFPMMPYVHFREMSDDDVQAVVAYLNSLPPIRHALPHTALSFPVGMMIKGVPKPVTSPVHAPDRSDRVAYGKYLAAITGCRSCHGEDLATGTEFAFTPYHVFAANISPDRETGIGKWTEKDFLDKFASYRDYIANGPPKVSADSFTMMPWLAFAQMNEDDLRAIYAFLHSAPPVKKAIETHPKK